MLDKYSKYKHTIQDRETDCGVACTFSLLKYWGKPISYKYIQNKINADGIGTSIIVLQKFLSSFLIRCKVYKVKKYLDIFNNLTISEFPFILFLENNESNHFIIVYEIKNNRIIYSDPKFATIKKSKLSKIISEAKYIISCDARDIRVDDSLLEKESNSHPIIDMFLPERKVIFKILFLSFLISVISLIVTSTFGFLIDFIFISETSSPKILLFLIIVIISLVSIINVIITFIKRRLAFHFSRSIEMRLYNDYMNNMFSMKLINFKNNQNGDYIARLEEGMKIVETFTNFLIGTAIDSVFCVLSFIFLFCINQKLSYIYVLFLIIIFIIIYSYHSKLYINNYSVARSFSNMKSCIIESVSSIESIKLLNQTTFYTKRFNTRLNGYIKEAKKNDKLIQSSLVYQHASLTICNIVILLLGALSVLDKNMTLGQLAIFTSISSFLFNSLSNVISVQFDIEMLSVSYARLRNVFLYSEKENHNEKTELSQIQKIIFKNVTLTLSDYCIFNDMNIQLSKDMNNIVISGYSGSGKTSFANLIIKKEENYTGAILIDNVDIKDIDTDALRSKIIYLSNNDKLFNGTIYENLCLDKVVFSHKVIKVCKDLNILDFINSLPGQFNYIVDDNGKNLSLGQAQRIIMAKALIQNPEVIIFDEIFSNLDIENRNEIISNLQLYNCLKIFISHQPILVEHGKYLEINNKKLCNKKY